MIPAAFRLPAIATVLVVGAAYGSSPTRAEISRMRAWSKAAFMSPAKAPFSFLYGGKPSSRLLSAWKVETTSKRLDNNRTQIETRYLDPETQLQVTCRRVEYRDFPTVEWTLTFTNKGKTDSPVLSDIRPLDLSLDRSNSEFLLHWSTPDNCTPDSYAPHADVLSANAVFRAASADGRPTSGGYPFWNVEFDGGGMVLVLGWPGQWSGEFQRDSAAGLRVRAGQELTHFRLRPSETVRTPMAVAQMYQGDWIRGQNIWRRWMVAHNLPRPGGKLVPTHYAACFANLMPRAEEEIGSIEGLVREKIKLDYWILDAGWYVNRGGWWDVGTWEVDRGRFPKGVREVADHAHKNEMGFVLWFEPERANGGTWLPENHPEWLFGGKDGGGVRLSDPKAWAWVVEKIDSLIVSEGVDVYRQDHNFGPIAMWRANDTPDRQGITEIREVEGYLSFWDELLRRHPKMWIDSCASGGRRNDLETLRRSVPLLRSDAFDGPITQQCQTYGLSLWLPYYGSGTGIADEYTFRSNIFPASRIGVDARDPKVNYPLVKRMIAEFRKVQPYLLDDYYPLTPYSLSKDAWIGWQFDSPEKGGGFVQAFRREESSIETMSLYLRGLDPNAMYLVEGLHSGSSVRLAGKELMARGLNVELKARPDSALFVYHKAR